MPYVKFNSSRQLSVLELLFEQANETGDVRFLLENGLFKPYSVRAHKCVLAAESLVFKAIFFGTMEKHDDIPVMGVSWDVFYDFIALFYGERKY